MLFEKITKKKIQKKERTKKNWKKVQKNIKIERIEKKI